MKSDKLQINFFYILLIVVAVLTILIFLPYWKPLFLAILLATIFYPLYRKMHALFRGGGNIAALITVILIILLILIPSLLLGYLLFHEATALYLKATTENTLTNYLHTTLNSSVDGLNNLLPYRFTIPPVDITTIDIYIERLNDWLLGNIEGFFSGALTVALSIFIMLFALFFFLRDGRRFREAIIALSPLSDKYDAGIFHKMAIAMNSVIKGSILIAVIQGILATIGFLFFGLPNPILWGATAMVVAFVPSVGTSLVIIPAVIYILATAGMGSAIGLLVWGVLIVGLVDNFLRPVLIERDVKIHPFLILISVIGGIGLFGPIGFLLGPIVLALLFALIDILPEISLARHDKPKAHSS